MNEKIYTYDTINQVPKSTKGDWYEEFTYEPLGFLMYSLGKEGLQYNKYDRDYYMRLFTERRIGENETERAQAVQEQIFENQLTRRIYDKIDGQQFLSMVNSGCLINYDGLLCEVYVDGYKTNLGLEEAGMHQGDFRLSGEVFEELCKTHDVWVNWANK